MAQFGLEQRRAMRTIAMFDLSEKDIKYVSALLPAVERLWVDVSSWWSSNDSGTTPGATLAKAFTRIRFKSLIGIMVRYTWAPGEDEDIEEQLERALLDKES